MSELRRLLDDISLIETQIKSNLFEGGLQRVLNQVDKGDMFAVLTAFRGEFSKKENIQRNKALRNKLRAHGMGVQVMVGHWQESPAGVDYEEAIKNGINLEDTIEQSFFVSKNPEMDDDSFSKLIYDLISAYDQDAAVLGKKGDVYLIYQNGTSDNIGKGYTTGKIGQAYSQKHPKGLPFVFEGIEVPSNNIGKQAFAKQGLSYPRLTPTELKECKIRFW